jgi:uncharacterized protein (UPF0248 family)
MVFQTLNKLKWTGRLGECAVIFIDRGSPDDKKEIPGKAITEVKRDHFLFSEKGDETFIPNHRVLEIRLDGKPIWTRKTRKG